ncbi:MAG: glycerol-3-phosphate 1-O-acyltransferase PlsY [Candidatus Omnitrophota bacterium]
MTKIIGSLIVSYLIGAIPTAFLLGKIFKRIDIRKLGSGNVGATNAFRVLGKPMGISVLIFDIFKGFFVTTYLTSFVKPLNISQGALSLILGLTAIAGHNWTVFLKFKGGKGIATSLGVLFGLTIYFSNLWWVVLISFLIWLMLFLGFGYVSLASIICAFILPILIFSFINSNSLLLFSIIASIFAIVRHKSNIIRLLQHKEHKAKFPWVRGERF